MIDIDRATFSDLVHIADRMRALDRREVWELSRQTPLAALMRSARLSTTPMVARVDGEPAFAWGIYPSFLSNSAAPWALGTDRVYEHPKALLEASRRWVDNASQAYRVLRNRVHAENAPAIRYLDSLGFHLSEPYRTRTGAMARTFTMER